MSITTETQSIFDILNLWSVFRQGPPPPNETRRFYRCVPRAEQMAEKPSYRCTPTQLPFPLKGTAEQRNVVIKALWPQAIDPLFLSYELGAPVEITK